MNVDIKYGPGNSAAILELAPGEVITTEAGAMISMSGDMDITTTTHKKGSGGIFKAMKRMLAGENFFLNHFTAGHSGGQLILGTALSGDMAVKELDNERLIVQAGSFVAAEESVEMDMGWQGFGKALFSGEGAFWLNMSGSGKVIFNSFGAIYPIEVDGDVIVDTGHIVAFDETLEFKVTKAGGSWATAIFGGEGLVCKFSGRGTVYCQSHNAGSFGATLGPKLKARKA